MVDLSQLGRCITPLDLVVAEGGCMVVDEALPGSI